jgi:hypothetical protein
VRSEVWDPVRRALAADETGTFTYGLLHIDPDDGLIDEEYVVSREEFEALVERRSREDAAAVPTPVVLKPDADH